MLEAWRWLTGQACSSDQIVMRLRQRTLPATEQALDIVHERLATATVG
jgi:hypothetical protein